MSDMARALWRRVAALSRDVKPAVVNPVRVGLDGRGVGVHGDVPVAGNGIAQPVLGHLKGSRH